MNAIHFVGTHLAKVWPDLSRLNASDVDRYAARFRGGPHNWIVQTYLQLREPLQHAGLAVSISERFCANAVNIAHRDSLSRLWIPYARYYIIGVRADRAPIRVSDWELVQNRLQPSAPHRRYLPLWPQPGLLAREPTRANQIRCVAYFGRSGASSRWLEDAYFKGQLAQMGVRFETRDDRWFDYRDVDLVLAHRQESQAMLAQKPASKLINAWLAGVPALLSNEPAYAALRESELDYLGIDGPEAALAAIRRLQQNPALYEAMIKNGQTRANAYTVAASRERWLNFILNDVLPAARQAETKMGTTFRWIRKIACLAAQKHDSRVFRREHAAQLKQFRRDAG